MAEKAGEIFAKLSDVDISGFVEKGGPGNKFSFLNWAKAWELLLKEYPDSSYRTFSTQEGFPAFEQNGTMMVRTSVTVAGNTLEMWLPVQDEEFHAIKNPDASQINRSLMRCLVKNIAMFGLGFSLYTDGFKETVQTETGSSTLTPDEIKRVCTALKSLGKSDEEIKNLNIPSWDRETYLSFIEKIA